MSKLFPVYEVGSLPKLNARVKLTRGQDITDQDINEVKSLSRRFGVDSSEALELLERNKINHGKVTPEEIYALTEFNAILFLRLQESVGLDFVYDGEARRAEMYQHVARRIEGFEQLPEMIRSRGPDSWSMSVCVAEPRLIEGSLDSLIEREFNFVKAKANRRIKVPIDDPYMIAVMSDSKYYLELLRPKYKNDPRRLRYEVSRAFTLALAKNVIRPQVEAIVAGGAKWIQLDIPAATLHLGHIPILVEGINKVVKGIEDVKFSLHMCYPRRFSLTGKKGYDLLFPDILGLNKSVDHLSLELANADQYETDLAVFAKNREARVFEIGAGVIDITLEQQQRGVLETPVIIRDRLLRSAKILGDPRLVYAAPDCGLRQLRLDLCLSIYEVLVEGAGLARKG